MVVGLKTVSVESLKLSPLGVIFDMILSQLSDVILFEFKLLTVWIPVENLLDS